MGNTDSIPVVSQAKSAVQAASGDMYGALQTQENFTRQCPIISHLRTAIENAVPAEERRPDTVCNALADVIPVVGHIKGAAHYGMGDHPAGERAMKMASRTVGVVVGAALGFLENGPNGAGSGADAGNALVNGLIDVCEQAVRGEVNAGQAFDHSIQSIFTCCDQGLNGTIPGGNEFEEQIDKKALA